MSKNRILSLLSLLLLTCAAGILLLLLNQSSSSPTTTPTGKTYEVILDENGFSPAEIEIKPGDFIKFNTSLSEAFWPASDLHPTHGIYPEFDPQEPIDPDKSWTFQFLKSGRWKYHDHLSPYNRGTIIVQ
jgi:plastocyanin